MAKESIEKAVRKFTPGEAVVIFWKSRSIPNNEIAAKENRSIDWVEGNIRTAYEKLGFKKGLTPTQKSLLVRTKEVSDTVDRLLRGNPANAIEFPLDREQSTTETVAKDTEIPVPTENRTSVPLIIIGGITLAVVGIWAITILFAGPKIIERIWVMISPRSTQALDVPTSNLQPGQEISNERVTLRLKEVRWEVGRGDNTLVPVAFIFEFTNNTQDTILLQYESEDFMLIDDKGNVSHCLFYHVFGPRSKVSEPLGAGRTIGIPAFCGIGRVAQDVSSYTLKVHLSSLPESTWIAEVKR
jgi:hypothetical protein